MDGVSVFDLFLTGSVSLLLIVIGLVLLSGRGAWMIAGFNTLSKKEKAKYNRAALCKFIGKIVLPIGITMPLVYVGALLETSLFTIGFVVLSVGLIIFAGIYAFTGNRFKN